MKRISSWALGGAVVGLAAAALVFHLVAASGVTARSGRLIVHRGVVGPPAPEIRGDVLVRPGEPAQRLATAASAPLVGTQGPVAALSPDGKLVAYNSFRWNREIDWRKSFADEGIQTGDPLGVPTIRLRDLATRRETVLEPGSQSLAWRGDGALAYVRGSPPAYRANLPFQAEVVVRTPDGRMAVWTSEPDRYEILGWAGQALLVQRSFPGGAPDIVAMAGPSESHVVATSSLFIAISPDGANVLVEPSPAEVDHPRIRLVRVADGSELASLPVEDARDPVTGDHLAFVYGPGDWRGDHAVVASETGLLVLHTGETLQIEQVLRLEDAARPNGSLFEPRFADDRTIVAWGGLPESKQPMAVQYACDRFALSCTRSAPAAPTNVPRLVYDLSGGNR